MKKDQRTAQIRRLFEFSSTQLAVWSTIDIDMHVARIRKMIYAEFAVLEATEMDMLYHLGRGLLKLSDLKTPKAREKAIEAVMKHRHGVLTLLAPKD